MARRQQGQDRAPRRQGRRHHRLAGRQLDCSATHVQNNLLRFALANRNWRGLGIGGWAMKDERFTNGKRSAPAERDDSLDNFSLA